MASEQARPIPPPDRLPELRNWRNRLGALLDDFDDYPENLDPEAVNIHDGFVVPAYQVMKTDVAIAVGKRWDDKGREDLRRKYRFIATKWTTYKSALEVLALASEGSIAHVDAMERMEGPRSGYLDALFDFYEVFSATLDSLFPP